MKIKRDLRFKHKNGTVIHTATYIDFWQLPLLMFHIPTIKEELCEEMGYNNNDLALISKFTYLEKTQ